MVRERPCKYCGTEFLPKLGATQYCSDDCRKEGFKKRDRERTTKQSRIRKAAAVERFGGKCAHCGGEYPPAVFDFHHVNPEEKDRTPAQLWQTSRETEDAELKKCIMLCANCHRIVHIEEGV